MAIVNKDFKVKNGLIVEGTNATVNGSDIITEDSLTGGSQTNITVTYDAENKVVNFTANASVGEEDIQDAVGNAIANGSELSSGGSIVYDDAENALYITVEDQVSSLTTDDIEEGATNKYFADELAQDAVGNAVGTGLSYDDTSGSISVTANTYDAYGAASTAESNANSYTDTAIGALTTDDIEQGTTNKYFADSLARDAVSAGAGLDYNSTSGEFSADLGNGLQFDGTDQIEIDTTIVATQDDLSGAIDDHNVSSGVHGVTGDVVGTTDAQTISNKTLGNNLDAGTYTITNLGTPTNASDAATKAYVDSVSEGLHVHESVDVATTANITSLTSPPATIDGVTLIEGMRVLVKNQNTTSENGIYVFNGDGNLVRADDFNSAAEIAGGDFTFVTGGTLYNNTGWVQTEEVTTVGTDSIVWIQFAGAGTFTAGNGLTLNGTEFAIDDTIVVTETDLSTAIGNHSDETTGVHGVTGDIVGTTDTQTLTNKTLGADTALGADLDAVNTYKIVNLEDPTSNQDAATKKYVDDEVGAVQDAVDGLTTDDVPQGSTNIYFTDELAQDAVAAAIAAGTHSNISITYDDLNNSLSFSGAVTYSDEEARDAVAGMITGATHSGISVSYTDDGANAGTLAFTNDGVTSITGTADQISASSSSGSVTLSLPQSIATTSTPTFGSLTVTNAVTASSVTLPDAQVGSATATASTTATVIDTWSATTYNTAKYLVQMKKGTNIHVIEVLVTVDGDNNIYITEYAEVISNTSLGTTDADYSSGNVRLLVTAAAADTSVKISRTLIEA